ncbi:GIY-YIG nuclease family protein [Tamlana fucoidanivorans]|uniref:GIY-YIG nuclease family protein n=2 Tax=Allotamlana fucoidanivorans TaxID=2583814 RepID=A0A5C4SSZ6_9FLAO|nr:GIY-YIG nuclease family protein [Tamlana fucoidanivorans]TNJ47268.1 GIY-YIG nuclease family protein [Tamlana fucoidanivorans]
MKTYYVYILECSDASYYVGVTSCLTKRLFEHNKGINILAYTYKRRPVALKWYSEFTDVNLAIEKEKQLKGWSRRKKKALIDKDWEKLIRFSKNHSEVGSGE